MNNDELAKKVEDFFDSVVLREAAARLRKLDKQESINKELVDENDALRAKLKVAEDALKPWPSLAEWLVVNAAKLRISDMVEKLRERIDESNNAIAAIREEGCDPCNAKDGEGSSLRIGWEGES